MIQFPSGRFLILDGALLLLGVWANLQLVRSLKRGPRFNAIAMAALTVWFVVSIDFGLAALLTFPGWILWVRAGGFAWLLISLLLTPLVKLFERYRMPVDSGRRKFLQTAGFAAIVAPLGAARAGFVLGHRDAMVHEADMAVE